MVVQNVSFIGKVLVVMLVFRFGGYDSFVFFFGKDAYWDDFTDIRYFSSLIREPYGLSWKCWIQSFVRSLLMYHSIESTSLLVSKIKIL